MLLDEKPLDSLGISDVQKLVSESVCESRRLEYKSAWWGSNDEARREMLRDISAFANSEGGHILLGIEVQRGAGAGDLECPSALVGVPRADYSEKILRSCRDNLDPPCKGIGVRQIELDSEKIIVVIRVPQSLTAPHMVTFKGLNQLWQRHGTDKQPMSTAEIRELIHRRSSFEERLLAKVGQQLGDVVNRTENRSLLRLWAAPVMPPLEEIDVRDQGLREILGPSLLRDPLELNCALYSGRPFPTLRGILAQEKNDGVQYLELHRDGYLEFGTSRFFTDLERRSTSSTQKIWVIVPIRVAVFMENFASLVTTTCSHLQMQGPLVFGCTLLRVGNMRLFLSRYETSDSTWVQRDIDLDYKLTYDFDSERTQIIRSLNDRLWNAFHFDECPFYQTGELRIPSRS
ncbi:MAG: helix-turn-helix domain-containing protein [Anaerolineae bacterium]